MVELQEPIDLRPECSQPGVVKPIFELETSSRGPFQDDPSSCGSPRRWT